MENNTEIKAIPFRPISAKFSGLQVLRNSKTRPQSAVSKAMMMMMPRSKTKNEHKPKLKKNFLSREELTEKLLYFQGSTNSLKEENLRLKTRIKFLERDLKRDESDTDKSHLVVNLKTQIKELQKIIENRDIEIADLKKTARITKVQELEVEMKMYVDECTRLRRMLQESLYQLFMGVLPQDIQQKYIQQSLQLKALKKDYKDLAKLSEDPTITRNRSRKEISLVKLKKNLINTKEENMRMNEDNQRLIQELNSLRSNLRCPSCGYIFEETEYKDVNTIVWDIWQAIEHRKLTIDDAWNIINHNNYPDIPSDHFKQSLEKLGLFLSDQEISYFFPNDSESINFESFQDIIQKLRPAELICYQDMKEILAHLSYRLQVRRYEFEQIPALLFPEPRPYYQMEIYAQLQQEPICLSDIQAEMLTKFLYGSSQALTPEECTARLYELIDPWQVLSEQEESSYDQELRKIVLDIGEELLEKLKISDTDNTGFITLERFFDTFKLFNVEISRDIMNYLTLLFYSDQFEFNLVPYKNFYQGYSSQNIN